MIQTALIAFVLAPPLISLALAPSIARGNRAYDVRQAQARDARRAARLAAATSHPTPTPGYGEGGAERSAEVPQTPRVDVVRRGSHVPQEPQGPHFRAHYPIVGNPSVPEEVALAGEW